ncbi:MAG: hypothetical protein AB8B47_05490 [Roseobacter sp.]
MISIRPDPAHPRGGYAQLSLPEDQIAGDQTQVSVFDNYSERYLGDAGWQPTKVLFGPYTVDRSGGQAQLVIGPEIVNQIEEYANVKLIVGDSTQDISWPDEIVPAPGAAKIGGIMGASVQQAVVSGALKAKMPQPEPEAPTEPEVITDPAPLPFEEDDADVDPPKSGKTGMLVGLLVMVLLAAGVAYWFLNMDTTIPPEPVAAPIEPVAPVVQADPCSMDVLGGLDGFAAQADALRGCGASASADAALGLLERAATAGDSDALLLFGTIYDGQVSDSVIEDQIGLTFGDKPATAAEYYARAFAAGSQDAADRLAELCVRMGDMNDTLAQGAVADYCTQ